MAAQQEAEDGNLRHGRVLQQVHVDVRLDGLPDVVVVVAQLVGDAQRPVQQRINPVGVEVEEAERLGWQVRRVADEIVRGYASQEHVVEDPFEDGCPVGVDGRVELVVDGCCWRCRYASTGPRAQAPWRRVISLSQLLGDVLDITGIRRLVLGRGAQHDGRVDMQALPGAPDPSLVPRGLRLAGVGDGGQGVPCRRQAADDGPLGPICVSCQIRFQLVDSPLVDDAAETRQGRAKGLVGDSERFAQLPRGAVGEIDDGRCRVQDLIVGARTGMGRPRTPGG